MPMDVISTMLGVPAEDRDRVRHLTNTGMHREGGLEIPASAQAGPGRGLRLLRGLHQGSPGEPRRRPAQRPDRRRDPREDGSLTKLSSEELLGFCLLLGNAGHETTARLICNSAVTLARNPDQRRQLVNASRKLMENAVEEMLRVDPPSQVQGRWTTAAVDAPRRHDPRERARAAAHGRRPPRRAPVPRPGSLRHPPQARPHGALRPGPPPLPREVAGAAGVPGGVRGDPRPLPRTTRSTRRNLEWSHNNNVRGYSKVPMRL